MPLADALSFVPDLLTAAAEPEADAAALTRLAEWCGRYSPWTAPDGADGNGSRSRLPAAPICGAARTSSRPIWRAASRGKASRTRIAIAGTLGAASALARFAAEPGRPALPGAGEERAALAPLPVEALRLDPATVAGLRRVGLRRVGDLYPMPREALARRFGEVCRGVSIRRSARFRSRCRRWARRRCGGCGSASPSRSPSRPISPAPSNVSPPSWRRIWNARAAGRAGSTSPFTASTAGSNISGSARRGRAAKPRHLAGLLAAKLETVDPGLGVEDMILALLAAEPLPPEQIAIKPLPPLHGNPLPRRVRGSNDVADAMAPLLDRLGARLGLDAIGRIAVRESHIPERASFFVPVGGNPHPNPPPHAGEGACLGSGTVLSCNASIPSPAIPGSSPGKEGSGWGQGGAGPEALSKPPRPVRLFMPPEPVEAVWVLPDEPPFRFTWRRRAHRVCRAEGPERIAEEWWTPAGAAAAVSVGAIRDYYRVEDEAGRRFWLFRAGLPGEPPPRWFMHGLFA